MIRLVLIDDQVAVVNSVAACLDNRNGFSIAGVAFTGREGIDLVARVCPDVAVVDAELPDCPGAVVTRRIVNGTGARVVCFSAYSMPTKVSRMLEAGALAYVLKTKDIDELVAAINAVSLGKPFIGNGLGHKTIEEFIANYPVNIGSLGFALTTRENHVIDCY